MTEQIELKVPYNEAIRISIQCPCGTETTIDISKETDNNFRDKWERKAFRCGLCGTLFDSNIKLGVANLIAWYQCINTVGDSHRSVFFQIRKA